MELKYILYARKSSESKERQVASISDQIAEAEIVSKRDHLNVKKVIKESKSAFKPHNRPAFDEMLSLIQSGDIQAILTWKEDRICRNPEEGGKVLQLLQDGTLKEIRTPTSVYTPESDHLILQIQFGMANQFSRVLSQNVLRGLKYKAARGEYNRPAPIGYLGFGDTRNRKIKPHPTTGTVIQELFKLAATGNYSLSKLQLFLFQSGVTTKAGKKISKSHVERILHSPVYYGYFYYKDILYEGNFIPLISKALYDKALEGLKRRSKPRTHTWTSYQSYNGLISCAKCGCSITTSIKRKHYARTARTVDYVYHHCTGRRKPCPKTTITTAELEAELVRNITKINLDLETMKLALELARAKYEQDIQEYSKIKRSFESKLKGLEDRLRRLVNLRMDGELSKEEFAEQKEILLNEKIHYQQLLKNDAYQHGSHWLELVENFFQRAFESGDTILYGEPEEKRNLIIDVGQNLFLNEGKIDIQYKKPYDVLASGKHRTNVQGWRDSNPHERFWRPPCYH